MSTRTHPDRTQQHADPDSEDLTALAEAHREAPRPDAVPAVDDVTDGTAYNTADSIVDEEPAEASSTAPSEPESARDAELSERDARILEFERHWAKHAGAKEEAIRAEFSLPAARYYQLLNAVIDLPGAVRTDPMLVRRLQRARQERVQSRAARSFSSSTGHGADVFRPQPPESNK